MRPVLQPTAHRVPLRPESTTCGSLARLCTSMCHVWPQLAWHALPCSCNTGRGQQLPNTRLVPCARSRHCPTTLHQCAVRHSPPCEARHHPCLHDSTCVTEPDLPQHCAVAVTAAACRIPAGDLLGVTALLLTCSYKSEEFVRVGYYVNIEYEQPEAGDPNNTEPLQVPNPPPVDKLVRNIMAGE